MQMQRWIQEGRGLGHGVEYRPWRQVQDVLSIGHAHKVPGLKVRRMHQVLSDLEAACLTLLEFQPDVLDIREQFPLLPTELTERAAAILNVRHPVYVGTHLAQVLTTDFCVDVKGTDQSITEVAIAVKYGQDLVDACTRELLAIEREANRIVGRRWFVFTEITVPGVITRNLAWLRGHASPLDTLNKVTVLDFCRTFRRSFRPDLSLGYVLTRVQRALRISASQALELFAIAAWHQYLVVRLDVEISVRRPLVLADRYPDLLRLTSQ